MVEISLFFTKNSTHLSYNGIDISIPINKTVITVLIISNIFFIHWIYKHLTTGLFDLFILSIREKFKTYLILMNAERSQNLINNFGDVFKYKKDIYYIDGYAIIKTGQGTIDKEKFYDGYLVKMRVVRYYLLITRFIISSIPDMEFFINCLCIVFLVTLIPLLIIQKIM